GDALASGQWGIREPTADAAEVAPDVLLVPLLAFDRTGNRIGYGAGYYDMTIAKFRATKSILAVGIAYAAQEIPAVPVTERGGRRRHHRRQSFVGPARGARLHRTRAAANPPAQLSARNARARHGAVRCGERRARAGHQPDGARVHGPARRSVPGGRARTHSMP